MYKQGKPGGQKRVSEQLRVETFYLDSPCEIRKMGTSGLRETQEVYDQPCFLEQFAEGVARYFYEKAEREVLAKHNRKILIGGDPRKGNSERIKTFCRVLTGHGFYVLVARNGLATTPSMSHAIRSLQVAGGVILTASHNPYTDVGIKINTHDGSPALDETVNRIHELQNSVTEVKMAIYEEAVQAGAVMECDVIALYTRLLDDIFDFEDIRTRLTDRRFHAVFDGMHGAAGPFVREIFIHSLGMNAEIIREEPREDLGGHDEKGEPMHPEPDFGFINQLMEMNASGKYDLVAAWDSDVDRRLDGGSGFFLESADEFAVFARYSHLIKIDELFEKNLYFCRSTVTAHTIDLMEEYLKEKFPDREVRAIQTPTGFKWIADLGNWGVEESNGVGNPYLREKDGIFATLFLLKIMLFTEKTPRELMEEIWKDFGRVYFTRGEVSGDNESEKDQLVEILESAADDKGSRFGSLTLEGAEKWDYVHPETGELAAQGAAWVLYFSEGNTVKARFSGTGSGGYTLRIYCSKYDREYDRVKSEITMPMKEAFNAFLQSRDFKGEAHSFTDAQQPDPYK